MNGNVWLIRLSCFVVNSIVKFVGWLTIWERKKHNHINNLLFCLRPKKILDEKRDIKQTTKIVLDWFERMATNIPLYEVCWELQIRVRTTRGAQRRPHLTTIQYQCNAVVLANVCIKNGMRSCCQIHKEHLASLCWICFIPALRFPRSV